MSFSYNVFICGLVVRVRFCSVVDLCTYIYILLIIRKYYIVFIELIEI